MRINVVGAGARGRRLLEHLVATSGVEIGFVADPSVEGRGRVQHEFPDVPATAEVRAALRDPRVEAIVLATPAEFHAEYGRVALDAGKHLLIADPIVFDPDTCQELDEQARAGDQILALGGRIRFDARVEALADLIASGELGHVRHVHSMHTRLGGHRSDASALWTLAAEDLAIFGDWLQLTPVHVSASAGCFVAPGVSDVVDTALMYAGGGRASIHASWFSPRAVHQLTVVGDRAMATLDLGESREPLLVHDRAMSVDTNPARCRVRDEGMTVVPVPDGDATAAQIAHFVACVRGDERPRNGAAWAGDLARQLVAIEHSIKEHGNKVTVGMRRKMPSKGPLVRTFADRPQAGTTAEPIVERMVERTLDHPVDHPVDHTVPHDRARRSVPVVRPRAIRPKTPR